MNLTGLTAEKRPPGEMCNRYTATVQGEADKTDERKVVIAVRLRTSFLGGVDVAIHKVVASRVAPGCEV